MTPLALKCWQRALVPKERQALGDMLSATQFFDCSALTPLIDMRMSMPDAEMASIELIEAGLPASKTWLDFGKKAVFLSDDIGMLNGVPNARVRIFLISESRVELEAYVLSDGTVNVPHTAAGYESDSVLQGHVEAFMRASWFAIEAMQTPNLTHRVLVNSTRQQLRYASRAGSPCHKWVDIRLGRGCKSGGGSGGKGGRTVAWHYRRGHKVNHPNPNYPKWRKGCWCGDTDAGIRTHNYIVEVPE